MKVSQGDVNLQKMSHPLLTPPLASANEREHLYYYSSKICMILLEE